jgi:hypothetical protein
MEINFQKAGKAECVSRQVQTCKQGQLVAVLFCVLCRIFSINAKDGTKRNDVSRSTPRIKTGMKCVLAE